VPTVAAPAAPVALAVDVGGTKIEVGIVSAGGEVLWSAKVATPPAAGEEVWAALSGLVATVPAGQRPAVCGVGCGGPMSPGGEEVSPLNIPGWRDFPLRARLAELTGLEVWVDNDAKALALAEGWRGSAAGIDAYLAMVVSTGIGGGIVLDGRLLDGHGGNAGHIGHVVVEPEGRLCECGGRGCLEAEASGRSIRETTGRSAALAGPDVRARAGTLVGRAVASVANLLDLRLASVAGSVALGYGEGFFGPAQAELDARARLSFSRGCRIEPSALGAEGPLVGAAAVAWRAAGRLDIP
jgi:glucokinase